MKQKVSIELVQINHKIKKNSDFNRINSLFLKTLIQYRNL